MISAALVVIPPIVAGVMLATAVLLRSMPEQCYNEKIDRSIKLLFMGSLVVLVVLFVVAVVNVGLGVYAG